MSNVERMRKRWQAQVRKLLCQRARPTQAAWRKLVVALVNDIAALGHLPLKLGEDPFPEGLDPREPLVWAWCVLDAMPGVQEQQYMALKERAADGSGIEDQVEVERLHPYVMASLPTAIADQVPWLATLARVLDDDLSSLDYWPEDVKTWLPVHWQPPGYDCWVVPVERGFRLADGRTARRRGLRYHAIIPHRIADLEVELAIHPEATSQGAGTEAETWTFGAAVFSDLVVTPSVSNDLFHLVRADCSDELSTMDAQVEKAAASGCSVLVWPELTMPTERLDLLRKALARDLLSRETVPLIVAGSWHVAADGPDTTGNKGRVNRAEVLLNEGSTLLIYDKRRIFPWKGLREAIDPGAVLPVIVMEDRLIGVEICRDHCDDNAIDSYIALPLDVVLVPSMGGVETFEAHQRHSRLLHSRQGTFSFIVQQEPAVSGYSPTPGGTSAFSALLPSSDELSGARQGELFRAIRP